MTRLLTLVVLCIAVASTLAEAQSTRIHVTGKVVESTFTGKPAKPRSATSVSPPLYWSTTAARKWALAWGFDTRHHVPTNSGRAPTMPPHGGF